MNAICQHTPDRCASDLPDNPQCAPNYHFGMLLGVEDFQTEQGFHVGRLRRHQRLLHGAGVVAGFAVTFDDRTFQLEVGPGHAIDEWGRDLFLAEAQCLDLTLWWQQHAQDPAFADIRNKKQAQFDLDVLLCYNTCLDRPVPAIAEPCSQQSADIAYSRICETVTLKLVRHVPNVLDHPYHLIRLWQGLDEPEKNGEGKLLSDDAWLLEQLTHLAKLPSAEQIPARAALIAEICARATAATTPFATLQDNCLPLAQLQNVLVKQDGNGWSAQIGKVNIATRNGLLPTNVLQALLLNNGQPAIGPTVIHSELNNTSLTLTFNQKLAQASLSKDVILVNEFSATTGWQSFTLNNISYDDSKPHQVKVSAELDRLPQGKLLRICIIGTGCHPLLGANLIPAGATFMASSGLDSTLTINL